MEKHMEIVELHFFHAFRHIDTFIIIPFSRISPIMYVQMHHKPPISIVILDVVNT
jgi:hypothetical protein